MNLLDKKIIQAIISAMEKDEGFSDREIEVFRLREVEHLTWKDIGHQIERSDDRARQINAKTWRKLKHPKRHSIFGSVLILWCQHHRIRTLPVRMGHDTVLKLK